MGLKGRIKKTQYGKHQQDAIYDPTGIAPAVAPGTHGGGSHLLKVNLSSGKRIKGWVETDKRIFAYQGDEKRSTAQETIIHKPADQSDALGTGHIPKVSWCIPEATLKGKKLPYMGGPPKPKLEMTHPLTAGARYFVVSGPARSTGGAERSTDTTGAKRQQATLGRFDPTTSRTSTFSARDFLAKVSRSLEKGRASETRVGRCFTRYAESLGLRDLACSSWRTLRDFYRSTEEKPSEPYFRSWGTSDTGWSGRFLTARTTESPRTASACSLSDILEESVDKRYFLSPQLAKTLLKHLERHREEGHGFGMKIVASKKAGGKET